MEYRIVPIQQLSDGQVADLAKLHHAVLHSLLSDLGLPFVERYYQIARGDGSVTGFCALSEAGGLLGWVVGSSKPEQINGQMREPWMWFLSRMIRVLLTRPKLIWQLFVSARSASFEMQPDSIELVYLGVVPPARNRGLGRALLDAFAWAVSGQYRFITLSVEQENAEAIQLYTKAGYKVTDTVVEGAFKRHRMELKILP